MLKLITFRPLNGHLERIRLCTYKNVCSVPSIFLTSNSEKQSSQNTWCQYLVSDVNQLHNALSTSTKIRLPSLNDIHAENVQDLFNTNEILDSDVQSIVNYVILASKCGVSCSFETDECNSFLNRLSRNVEQMSPDDAVSALIALNLLIVPLHHPVNRDLTIKIIHMLKDLKEFPLIPLTNLAIYAHENQDKVYPHYLCAQANSHVLEHLSKCENFQDFHYVTLCFKSLSTLCTKEFLSIHKEKMKIFLEDRSFDTKANLRGLFEVLNFYNLYRGKRHQRLIRNMLLMMAPEIPNLSNSELCNFALYRDSVNEPASLIKKIVETAESRPTKSTDLNLIYCRLARKTPENLENISKDLEKIIENLDSKDIIKNKILFWVLQKKQDNSMRNNFRMYWSKCAEDLSRINNQGLQIDSILCELSFRYCLVQKRTNHRFRCRTFESLLRELTLIEIKHGVTQWKPSHLASLSTFIIAYANDPSLDRICLYIL
ncbi:uncharacterized protein LOC116350029 [Contarinia nasturtii]|uniref:uncharacterized protein LOC116350029 n=1 Tax=Contarinia nasturtii TaxID=265458 RepID=UPI0012D42E4C|nr:uncharacterized protein LOC116350029 [Contarinia nasturtii]